MKVGSKKNIINVTAIDPNGRPITMQVERDSPMHRRVVAQRKKFDKEQKLARRAFKDQLRKAKKTVPPELRAKVKWS